MISEGSFLFKLQATLWFWHNLKGLAQECKVRSTSSFAGQQRDIERETHDLKVRESLRKTACYAIQGSPESQIIILKKPRGL